MRRVRILPDDLADQIAAGEVVERPASVVKELVENALDAGARTLRVDIESGGVGLVRVSDDGQGMDPEDAQLAVRRHATSKLASIEDLSRITTLGFRGEALPSIASVSRFVLTTRTRDADVGTEVRVEGGTEHATRETGCAPGTTVTVRDLFFNIPARRKFLKATATESAHVREVVIRAALARPELRIVLSRDGRQALELLPSPDLGARAIGLFPEERLARIAGSREGIGIDAWLSPPERARPGAQQLHLYVNGRPVRDRALARAVAFAYGSVLPTGKYPAGVVHLVLAPDRVDVNVHPQKAEVRFEDARAVLDAITRVLAHGLGTHPFRGHGSATGGTTAGASGTSTSGPSARGTGFWHERLGGKLPETEARVRAEADPWGLAPVDAPPINQNTSEPGNALPGASLPIEREAPAPPRFAGSSPTPYDAQPITGLDGSAALRDRRTLVPEPGAFGALRVIGQLRRTYILCEGPTALLVVDQHAADERVRFDRLRAEYGSREVARQRLLIPERVEVAATEATLVEEQAQALGALGVDAVRLGETTVAVNAIPALVRRARPEQLLRDVLAQLALTGDRAFGDAIDTALATMACHGAVRAGDALDEAQMRELLRRLDGVSDFARHCPHGRPVAFEVSLAELGRRVGR